MSFAEEEKVRRARAEKIGLFRYALIREAADPSLTARQRGALVREIAEKQHAGPFGEPVRISRESLDRWIRAWRIGGFDALVPEPRRSAPRTDAVVLELALALKKENPARDAVQIGRILRAQLGWAPGDRTLQRHLARAGLSGQIAPVAPTQVFGRFEAERPNELWVGDACHGPVIAGRKAILFAFLDDHSRQLVGARWGYAEDTVRLAAALRPALASRGIPGAIYVDNGSAFVDAWLLRACARLGIKLVHSTPGRPQGRGKIERYFGTVRDEFLVEVTGTGEGGRRQVESLTELNRLFQAWSEVVYHRRTHSETGQAPAERYAAVGIRGIHTTIVTALGGAPAHHTATLIPQATDALAAEHHERGKTPIIVLDEAHLLTHQQLEAVRMLTNHEMDSASTTAVLLIGQPTLKRQMRLGVLAALEQRILLRYTMTGMTTAETAEYIRHHTALAGRSDTLFSDDAAKLIHETGRGHPRAVNKLAITALTAAFAENKAIVDESSVRAAITELTTD